MSSLIDIIRLSPHMSWFQEMPTTKDIESSVVKPLNKKIYILSKYISYLKSLNNCSKEHLVTFMSLKYDAR